MRISECFPSDFSKSEEELLGFVFFLFPPCYFVATNLKVSTVFLKNWFNMLNIYYLLKKQKTKKKSLVEIYKILYNSFEVSN